ncbi:hypothetical protein C8R45DRAFT_1114037 [Mycena sanguinolenta]|nr:hypothetical protein C8R45DRAFT_1114037 [Mycena sanguinolenta]
MHFQYQLGHLSHPVLAVTGSVVALPCSPSSSPRRRTYLPANPGKGICRRRLGLDTAILRVRATVSAPTDSCSRPSPTNPVPLSRLAGGVLRALRIRLRYHTQTHMAHTPSACLTPERNHSINESRPRTKTTTRNRCDDAVVRSPWAIAQTHTSTSHTLPTSEAVAMSDSLSPRRNCLSPVTSPRRRQHERESIPDRITRCACVVVRFGASGAPSYAASPLPSRVCGSFYGLGIPVPILHTCQHRNAGIRLQSVPTRLQQRFPEPVSQAPIWARSCRSCGHGGRLSVRVAPAIDVLREDHCDHDSLVFGTNCSTEVAAWEDLVAPFGYKPHLALAIPLAPAATVQSLVLAPRQRQILGGRAARALPFLSIPSYTTSLSSPQRLDDHSPCSLLSTPSDMVVDIHS